MSPEKATKLGLERIQLPHRIKVFNVDGTANKTAWIMQSVTAQYVIGTKQMTDTFLISGLGKEEVILGLLWLWKYNPDVDWVTGRTTFPGRCYVKIPRTSELSYPPHKYLVAYQGQFEDKEAERFPISRSYDHTIELKLEFTPRDCKVYSLMALEQTELDTFLKENLRKGYIRKSKSPMASPFFFNAYPLPLVSDLIDKLKDAAIFSKLDLCNSYNNVRIKDGDQWKAAFKTNRGLFEPTVMFFGLMNSPATFQAFMDDVLQNFMVEGWCIVYMDDILIYSDMPEQHQERTI
uniref:Reverse transcriptase domain-containing protein n=1 Tax=Moniliophthora roreri TaxID=221103 RepID=A0A0W0FV00_MONRR